LLHILLFAHTFFCLLALTDEGIDDLLEERKAAALVLSRMLQERVVGPKVRARRALVRTAACALPLAAAPPHLLPTSSSQMFILVQRFLPFALARELRESPDEVVRSIDKTHETPEVVWDNSCRRDLRQALTKACKESDEAAAVDGVWKPAGGHEKYRVSYALLDGEVMVGGVYLRIFLKDPTFPLRDPKAFLESMLRLLNSEAEAAVAVPARSGSSDGSTKEALMMALTSSTVCLFKVQPRLMAHLAT